MLADEISHNVLATFIATLGLIMVPVIGYVYVNTRNTKATKDREQRVDMVALRERVDDAANAATEAEHIALEAQERRAAEHGRIFEQLERIIKDLEEIRSMVGPVKGG